MKLVKTETVGQKFQKIIKGSQTKVLELWEKRWFTRYVFPLLLFSLFAFISMREVLGDPGTIGLYHDWFIGPTPELISSFGNAGSHLLSPELGNKIYPTDWLFRLCSIPFAGLGGEVVSKGFLFGSMVVSGLSMYALGRGLRMSYPISLIIGLIFLMTPVVFTRCISGYLYYLFAYAIAPLLILMFIKAIDDPTHRIGYSLAGGLIFGLMATQIQFLVMGAMILLALALADYKRFRTVIPIVFVIFLVAGLMQLPWLLPLAQNQGSAAVLNSQSFLDYHEMRTSPSLWESIRMIGYNIHVYGYKQLAEAGVIPEWVMLLNISFSAVAITALLFKRNKYTIPLGALLVSGIFLAKGISEPGQDIFIFLFQHTPLILFREIWHIVFIPIFAGTVLIGFCLDSITAKYDRKLIYKPWNRRKRKIISYAPAIALASLIIVTNGYPMFRGDFAGYVHTYEINEDYQGLIANLTNDPESYRIYWLPANQPVGYPGIPSAGADPITGNSPKPTNPGEVYIDRPMSRYNMWVITALQHNSTSNIGNLMSIADNKYVILREDFVSRYIYYTDIGPYPDLVKYWGPQLLINNTMAQDDLTVVEDRGNYVLFQNAQDPGFAYLQSQMVIGSPDLGVLTHLSGIMNLTQFGYLTRVDQLAIDNPLFLTKDDPLDVMSQIAGKTYGPGNFAEQLNPNRGWMAGRVWFWYDPLLADSTNNGALAIGDQSMDITIQESRGGELWAKVLTDNESGNIQFLLNGQDQGVFNTSSSAHYLKWIKICDLGSDDSAALTIHSLNGTNYIDQLMVLGADDKSAIDRQLASSDIVDLLTSDTYLMGPNASVESQKAIIPANSWVSRNLTVLKSGDRVAWISFDGNITVDIDGKSYDLTSDGETNAKLNLGAWTPGTMEVNITAHDNSTLGDIWITTDTTSGSLSDVIMQGESEPSAITVKQLSITNFEIKANLTKPTMLALAMPFDSGWRAIVNGHEYSPVPLYTLINGFWINETGDLDIKLVYMPQQSFDLGMEVAFLAIGSSLVIMAVQFIRPKWWERTFSRRR